MTINFFNFRNFPIILELALNPANVSNFRAKILKIIIIGYFCQSQNFQKFTLKNFRPEMAKIPSEKFQEITLVISIIDWTELISPISKENFELEKIEEKYSKNPKFWKFENLKMRSIYRENAKGIFVITCLYLLQGHAQNERSTLNDIFKNSQVTWGRTNLHFLSRIPNPAQRCWWRILERLHFGDRFEILVTDFLHFESA